MLKYNVNTIYIVHNSEKVKLSIMKILERWKKFIIKIWKEILRRLVCFIFDIKYISYMFTQNILQYISKILIIFFWNKIDQ